MIARIAGVELALPPPELLSALRRPADLQALGAWLRAEAPACDALIVCIEMLGAGGLIASRTTNDSPAEVLGRLEVLREIKRAHPSMPLLGFNVITRISNADDNIEEPLYWDKHGTRLYRLSQLMDRAAQGEPVDAALAALRAEVPPEHVRDWLTRRHRNHIVNLGALHLLADRVFDLLVLSSDDTSPFGLGTREKRHLAEMAGRLGLLETRETGRHGERDLADGARSRLLMYPGADEVGCALLARIVNQAAGRVPQIAPYYAVPGGAEIVAPYEDGPVRLTVERQIAACGAQLAREDDSDLWLAVNPPVPRRSEWAAQHAEQERAERLPHLQALAALIARQQNQGRPVIIADVAYPNGADPALIEIMKQSINLPALAAYGAWNTAGNTIGTALAQGCAALRAAGESQQAAQVQFLLHRFVEDWGYQQEVRRQARTWLLETIGQDDPTPEQVPATHAWIELRLDALIGELPGFAGTWRIAPGSVRLPWNRLFEADFELERTAYGQAGVSARIGLR
jgi:hypothetical protein